MIILVIFFNLYILIFFFNFFLNGRKEGNLLTRSRYNLNYIFDRLNDLNKTFKIFLPFRHCIYKVSNVVEKLSLMKHLPIE